MQTHLKVVLLRSPYDIWNYPEVGGLFVKMVGLKLSGYLTRYQYGVLPLDAADFVASHVLLFRSQGKAQATAGQLELISALKIITQEQCQRFNIPYLGLQVARGSGAVEHAEVVERLMADCQSANRPLSYVGSWTVAPVVRDDRSFSAMIRDIMISLVVNYHHEYRISDVIACGAPKVKSDRTVKFMGLSPLTKNGVELPGFRQASLQGEEAVMMASACGFSEEAKKLAKLYAQLWSGRRTIENSEGLQQAA